MPWYVLSTGKYIKLLFTANISCIYIASHAPKAYFPTVYDYKGWTYRPTQNAPIAPVLMTCGYKTIRQ